MFVPGTFDLFFLGPLLRLILESRSLRDASLYFSVTHRRWRCLFGRLRSLQLQLCYSYGLMELSKSICQVSTFGAPASSYPSRHFFIIALQISELQSTQTISQFSNLQQIFLLIISFKKISIVKWSRKLAVYIAPPQAGPPNWLVRSTSQPFG